MSDLNSTTEFLLGIRDWVQLENFPNFYLMLHGQLSLVKVGTYTTIKSFVAPRAKLKLVDPDDDLLLDLSNCQKILQVEHISNYSIVNLICQDEDDSLQLKSFRFNISDAWITDPSPSPIQPKDGVSYYPQYPETPVYSCEYDVLTFSNQVIKKALSGNVKQSFDHNVLVILDFLALQGQDKYYLNIYSSFDRDQNTIDLRLE